MGRTRGGQPIATLIGVAAIVGVGALDTQLNSTFNAASTKVNGLS